MTKKERFKETNKLSVLLSLALDDLELVEKDSNYKINMNTWHTKPEGKKCEVCLAGSVLAKTLNIPRVEFDWLEDWTGATEIMYKLRALDYIRRGDLIPALLELGHTKEHATIFELVKGIRDATKSTFVAVELILGEDWHDFYYNNDCEDFKDFVTFYRRVASKLNMVGL